MQILQKELIAVKSENSKLSEQMQIIFGHLQDSNSRFDFQGPDHIC